MRGCDSANGCHCSCGGTGAVVCNKGMEATDIWAGPRVELLFR